jgi:hypothetical protein
MCRTLIPHFAVLTTVAFEALCSIYNPTELDAFCTLILYLYVFAFKILYKYAKQ